MQTARLSGYTYVGADAVMGENAAVGNYCEINSGGVVGDGTLLNAYCSLNSGTIVGRGCILSTGVKTADEKYMTARTGNIVEAVSHRRRLPHRAGLGAGVHRARRPRHDRGRLASPVPAGRVRGGSPARFLRTMTGGELAV